ncbi:MAG: PIN domain-containing protein [Candidatus Omnitrophica bacterium]|nr:PIN domain-containing protein [Candidatus Omnitrophota bacterium]
MKLAVDTNVVLRAVLNDIPAMGEAARDTLSAYTNKDVFLSCVVLIEIFYVVHKYYKLPEKDTLDLIHGLLNDSAFQVEHEVAVRLALAKTQKGLPFIDTLIGEIGALRNLHTLTFDAKLLEKDKNFVPVKK